MAGGPDAAFAKVKPLFEIMGQKAVHCGASGNGQAAKICNNMILGVTMIATCEAFALAVGADCYGDPRVGQLLCRACRGDVIEIALRGLGAAHRAWLKDVRRHESRQDRVLPDVRLHVPVVLRGQATVGYDERWRIGDAGPAPELQDVVIEVRLRDVVLDRAVAVGHHREVHVVQRAALRDDVHVLFARRRRHLLALLAPRLVVVLDAHRALRLEPLHNIAFRGTAIPAPPRLYR